MKYFEGKLQSNGLKLGIVLSKFNSFIGERLLEGAVNAFEQTGGSSDNIDVYKVPGCYEIAGAAKRMIATGKYNAIVCIGVIIRGQTPHFEYVASNSAKAIMELSADGQLPVIYGLITADDVDQAIDRAGTKSGNKGYDAVMTAVEMVQLYSQIK